MEAAEIGDKSLFCSLLAGGLDLEAIPEHFWNLRLSLGPSPYRRHKGAIKVAGFRRTRAGP
jgi:hypothetical protein